MLDRETERAKQISSTSQPWFQRLRAQVFLSGLILQLTMVLSSCMQHRRFAAKCSQLPDSDCSFCLLTEKRKFVPMSLHLVMTVNGAYDLMEIAQRKCSEVKLFL